ncbi:alpha-E domain-containing protein, partial [Acidocella aminolytica]
VLPGGLGLPLNAAGAPAGLGTKDLWVLDSEEPRMISGAQPAEPPEKVKFLAAAHLPSRLADNLFWLGRSVERLEAAVRLLLLAIPRLESGTSLPRDLAERALISRCLAQAGLLPADIAGTAISGRLLRQTLARRKPIAGLLKEVARLVDASAERLSPSMLATVRFALQQATEALPNEEAALSTLLSFTATFAGIAAENMSRDGGWLFLEMGRRLERGDALAETLAILLDGPVERLEPGMALGIELADSVLSYGLRHAGIMAPGPVLAMLLADMSNPRSLAYQCHALRACLERLGADDDAETAKQLLQDIVNLAGNGIALRATLSNAGARLRTLSDHVQRRFFTLLPAAHALEEDELLEAAQ